MNQSVATFFDFLQKRSLPVRERTDMESIRDFEKKQQTTLPKDMCNLWLLMNGTEGACPDDLTFWRLEEIKNIPEVFTGEHNDRFDLRSPAALPNPSDYYVFSDYLICSFFYAICLNKSDAHGRVVFIDGESWFRCADSFSAFLESYMREAKSPHFCAILSEMESQ